MKATYEIIARRGLEGLIIQDITEAADVGYGSFYNHFPSKEAIVAAVNDAANGYTKEVHRHLASLASDRAERFAMSLRMSLQLIKADQVWGWFLIRTMLSRAELRTSIGDGLKQAIVAGLNEGVFKHEDIDMAYETIAGLLLLATLKLVSADEPEDYSDKLVKTALKTLGLREPHIGALMSKPLPELDLPPFLEAVA
jgi:AcrR family transcriptional regulator